MSCHCIHSSVSLWGTAGRPAARGPAELRRKPNLGAARCPQQKRKQWISGSGCSGTLCQRHRLTATDRKAFVQLVQLVHLKRHPSGRAAGIDHHFLADVQRPRASSGATTQLQVVIRTIHHSKEVRVASGSEDTNTETVRVSQKRRKCFESSPGLDE